MSDEPWKESNDGYLDDLSIPDDEEQEEWLQWLDETLEEAPEPLEGNEFPLDKTLDNL